MWCIADKKDEKKLLTSSAPVDGNKNEVNALGAAAFGLLSVLSVVWIIEKNWTVFIFIIVGEKEVVIQLDCKSLITKVTRTKFTYN